MLTLPTDLQQFLHAHNEKDYQCLPTLCFGRRTQVRSRIWFLYSGFIFLNINKKIYPGCTAGRLWLMGYTCSICVSDSGVTMLPTRKLPNSP